jgi:hypothetical protein
MRISDVRKLPASDSDSHVGLPRGDSTKDDSSKLHNNSKTTPARGPRDIEVLGGIWYLKKGCISFRNNEFMASKVK